MRRLLVSIVLLAGCGPRADDAPSRVDTSPKVIEAPAAELWPREQRAIERKRACIAEQLDGARPRDHALLRSLCAEWVQREIPGLALAIVEAAPEAAPLHVELGVRCFGESAPVEAATPFRLGSTSKALTAALVLGAAAEGRLGLDEAAGARVPGYEAPAGLSEATLDDLLRHVSGLGEIEPEVLVELDGAWLPALARAEASRAGAFRYSNAGYSLAGAMLGAATKRSYAELIAEELAGPLALASLSADPQRARDPACGHLEHDRDHHPISVRDDLDFMPGDPSWMAPAGGALASATDLARLALALGTDELPGTEAMLATRGTPLPDARRSPRRADERYGYGLRSWTLADGTLAYGHSGDNVAFRSELLFVPGRRAIVLLANRGIELTASVAAAEALLEAP